jgi:prolyl-tRNA synthetase
VRRDTGVKVQLPLGRAVGEVRALLDVMQGDLLAEATAFRDANMFDVATVDEAGDAAAKGFVQVPWAVLQADDGEARLREVGATVRVLRRPDGGLPDSEDEPDVVAIVARSY